MKGAQKLEISDSFQGHLKAQGVHFRVASGSLEHTKKKAH
jgi:hypothetical protein